MRQKNIEIQSNTKIKTIIFVEWIVIASILVFWLVIAYNAFVIKNLSGYYPNVSKSKSNGKWYVVIDKNEKIECSKERYDSIKTGYDYVFEYTKNEITGNAFLNEIVEESDEFN